MSQIRKTYLYLQRLTRYIMQNIEQKTPLANNHISVDCVVIGFDGEQLKVLLIKRAGEEEGEIFHDMKLPGSLIYMDEDLDEAAKRVLNELTGLKNVNLMQFKAFGSKTVRRTQRCALAGTCHAVQGGTYCHHSLSFPGEDRPRIEP